MRYKKEIRAFLIALVSIGSFIWLINFIKGKDLFGTGIRVYAVYDDVRGLGVSRPVVINGFKVGKVEDIQFHSDGSGRLMVWMKLDASIKIPRDSVALIVETGIVTGPQIELKFSKGGPALEDGDALVSRETFSPFNELMEKGRPLGDKLEKVLVSMNTTLDSINSILREERNKVSVFFKSLNQTSGSLNDGIDKFSNATVHFSQVAQTYNRLAQKIEKLEVDKTISNTNNSLKTISKVLEGIQEGKGSLGKLLQDDQLYTNLNNLSKEVKYLSEDFRINPNRYFHFSVFGKKQQLYKKNP